MFLRKWW